MEISDCIWDEDFLCCGDDLGDLEPSLVSSSIPSPGLAPFQWSASPLADEADNSDMTPQCMPVIDPAFVRDNFIEDCLLDGVSNVIETGDDVLSEYLADQESAEQFATLHVLVCGFCHSVFHVTEEFKSHLVVCDGDRKNGEYIGYDSTSAVALVLWTNTVLRRVRESLSELADAGHLTQRIQARWWRLSKRSRQVWEKAAEVVRELARVGSLVFPVGEPRPLTRPGEGRWPGPHHCVEADEIEMLGTIKVEGREEPVTAMGETIAELDYRERRSEEQEHLWFRSPNLSGSSERSSSPELDEPDPGGRTERRAEDTRSRKLPNRDRMGRWNSNAKKEPKKLQLSCDPCDFKTDNPWKLQRHMKTSTHISKVGGITGGAAEPSSTNLKLVATKNESFRRLEEGLEPPPEGMKPTPEKLEPPPDTLELPPERLEPPTERFDPLPEGLDPPPKGLEPPPDRLEPLPDRLEPPPDRLESPPYRLESPPEGLKPPFTEPTTGAQQLTSTSPNGNSTSSPLEAPSPRARKLGRTAIVSPRTATKRKSAISASAKVHYWVGELGRKQSCKI